MSLDNILQPDNTGDEKKKTKDDSTKNRLNGLKELLKADPVNLNTGDLLANHADFPASQQAKYIDYVQEKKNHTDFAKQVITNIIETYVKSKKLLDSPRLKDLKQKDIIKYSRLLLLVQISEENLIKLQESIDGGDMSKEMFDSVNKSQKEMRDNMEAEEKHLDKCEKYWSNYASIYGLENSEEKIVQEVEAKDDTTVKRTIIDMSKLSELIQDNLQKEKAKNKLNDDNDKRT
jgi:hypothetical protein